MYGLYSITDGDRCLQPSPDIPSAGSRNYFLKSIGHVACNFSYMTLLGTELGLPIYINFAQTFLPSQLSYPSNTHLRITYDPIGDLFIHFISK